MIMLYEMQIGNCFERAGMGGDGAILEPEESVTNILKVVTSTTPASSGKFFHHTGKELPW